MCGLCDFKPMRSRVGSSNRWSLPQEHGSRLHGLATVSGRHLGQVIASVGGAALAPCPPLMLLPGRTPRPHALSSAVAARVVGIYQSHSNIVSAVGMRIVITIGFA